jgi:hypothetical protein
MFGLKKLFERSKTREELGLLHFTHARGLRLNKDSKFAVQVMNLEKCTKCGSIGEVDCVSYELEDSRLVEHLTIVPKRIGDDIWYSGASGNPFCSKCIGVGTLMIEHKR